VKILVVEDNEITRKMVRITLRAESYEVLEAVDAHTALALAARERPDLVLQDLRLPDLDGFDLLRQLRALPGMADVPVIAVSGFVSRLDEARASSIGFTDFLVKPLQPPDLIRSVRAHLPGQASLPRTSAGHRILFADDDPVQRKLARTRLELHGFRVETAGDGLEALEMARAGAFDAVVSDVLMPRLDGFGVCLALRQDPNLTRLPVILCSNAYLEAEDEALGRRLGASAFVLRTPDLSSVVAALDTALREGPPAFTGGSIDELRQTHVYRVITQLEHHAAINAGLAQRAASQSAALAILSTISDTLAKSFDQGFAVNDVLASCLEAGGFSVGVLYLLDAEGHLAVDTQSGYYRDAALTEVAALFGHESLFRAALAAGAPLSIPSPAVEAATAREFLRRTGASSAVILPVLFGEERLGALLVATDLKDLSSQESLDFARTIGHQIGQVIALRRAFAGIAAAEEQYRGIFEHAVEGIFRSSPSGRYLLVNPAMARMFGYDSPEDMVASVIDIQQQFYADPAQRDELARRLGQQDVVARFEGQGRRKDGTLIWLSQSVRAVRDEAGNVQFYEGVIEDITERKKAEEATSALAATARALLESLDPEVMGRIVTANVCRLLNARSASVYRLDPESGDLMAVGPTGQQGQALYWTPRLSTGTGITGLALRTRTPQAAADVLKAAGVEFSPDNRLRMEAAAERAVLAVPLMIGERIFGALAIRDRTGRVFEPAEIRLAQAFGDQAAIALDNARLFEQARAGRDFLASVAQNSADGIVAADGEGRVTFFSQRAEEMWGRSAREVLGRPIAELLGESDRAQALLARLHVQHRIQNREITILDPEGRVVDLSVSLSLLQTSAGTGTGLVAVARDMTERKRTETALRQSEKLAAMSALVAGVAHELNNPLSVILAHSTLLLEGGHGRPEERAAKIIKAAQRCARLVKNFLALARQHPPERQRVGLGQVIRETIELVTYSLRVDSITVTVNVAADLPILWADPHQLQQVVLNLITNAHHALRAGAPPRTVTVTAELAPGPSIVLTVADNGPGIPPAVRERIFEPFFTTKPEGQGSGLGLSLCRGIIEGHGGTLELAPAAPGTGAVFTIVLPVVVPPSTATPEREVSDTVQGLSILVVDDEPDVAEVLVSMLQVDGHRAEIAANGLVALERLAGGRYDLVMSDLRMPEMNGPALYKRMEETGHPMLRRFVFVTGDVLGPETHEFLDRSRVPALSKPFVLAEVRTVIRQVLAASPDPA
jgi:PAS domain S-box-containing protein